MNTIEELQKSDHALFLSEEIPLGFNWHTYRDWMRTYYHSESIANPIMVGVGLLTLIITCVKR